MNNEMVERVARAIDTALIGAVWVNPYDNAAVVRVHAALRTAARAAIEAMREPSGAMVRACFAVSSSGWPQVIWPAMIDAALNERSDLT